MALLFDGIDDSLVLADHAALALGAAWTIGGWVRRQSTNWHGELWRWGSGSPSTYARVIESDAATSPGTLYASFSDSVPVTRGLGSGGVRVDDGLWHHLAWTRDASYICCWIDGVNVNTNGTAGLGTIDPAASFYLGASITSNWFRDRLAEWAKWDRTLPQAEIQALAAGKSPGFYLESLAWYLPMRAGAAETIVPLSVTNNSSGLAAHPAAADPLVPRPVRPPLRPLLAME